MEEERVGRLLRAPSGAVWLLCERLEPGVILCKNALQQRHGLLGYHFKRLQGGGYDHAVRDRGGRWQFAYGEPEAALHMQA